MDSVIKILVTEQDCNACAGVFDALLSLYSSSTDSLFYKYTSFDTFVNGIMAHKDDSLCARIRLSSLYYMNDPYEAKIGHDIFTSIIKCVSEKLTDEKLDMWCDFYAKNTFESSFSEEKDNLQMWSMYGLNGKGVSIGFNMKRLIECNDKNECSNRMMWAKCLYVKKKEITEKQDGFLNYLDGIYHKAKKMVSDNATTRELVRRNLIFSSVHSFLAALTKNADYEFEKESRLVIFPGNATEDDICYQLRKDNILAPYIDVDIPIDCIEEVWVGPNQNTKAIKESLEAYLNHKLSLAHSNHNIKVYESKVAYRSSINV